MRGVILCPMSRFWDRREIHHERALRYHRDGTLMKCRCSRCFIGDETHPMQTLFHYRSEPGRKRTMNRAAAGCRRSCQRSAKTLIDARSAADEETRADSSEQRNKVVTNLLTNASVTRAGKSDDAASPIPIGSSCRHLCRNELHTQTSK